MAKKMFKYEIACVIENLPGNILWTGPSLMTVYYNRYTRDELVSMYNDIIDRRDLTLAPII